jgi:multiple sugar transport system substrate-binding protein
MDSKKLSRREFLQLGSLGAAGAVLAACQPQVVEKAVEVEVTREVEKEVVVEQTVEVAAEAGREAMTFWPEWGGKDADALLAQVDKFTQETGIIVGYLPIRDHARMIASMSAGNPPDLLMTWDANSVGSWGFEEVLMDLGPYIEGSGFDLDALHPLGVQSGNLMGIRQIGLPLSNYITSGFWWNKDAFEAAGLDPETPPETWEETWEMAEQITVVEDGAIMKWGYGVNAGQDGHPTLMSYCFGGSIYSDDFREVTPDDEANIEALTWMRQFYEEYGADEIRRWQESMNWGADAPTYPLYGGDLGMLVMGEWIPSFVEQLQEEIDVNVGVAYMPYPASKPAVKGTMTANSNPMVIPTDAQNPDAGFQFIEFISRPENSGEMCITVGNASPVKAGLEVQLAGVTSPLYKWLLEVAWTEGNVRPLTLNTPVGARYRDAFDLAKEEVLEDGRDPLEAMQSVKDEIQPLLNEALADLGI